MGWKMTGETFLMQGTTFDVFKCVFVFFLFLEDVDDYVLEDRIRKKVISELRRTTYRWTPLK